MNRFLSLVLLPAAVFSPLAVFADDNSADLAMPTIIVSATRTEQNVLTTPASIRVITREQIDSSGAEHIVEVLRGQGGVQVNDLYGEGSRASVDLRGFGDTAGSATLVLIDGRRLNNPDIASPDLNSIALNDVERIEILQGSAGVLFGDQAVGGVINIITRQVAEAMHTVRLSAGSYRTVQLHGVTSQALDNGISYRLALDIRESDNYRDHNESSYFNGFGKLAYDYDRGTVFAELQLIDDKLNTPGTLFADQLDDDRRQVAVNFANDFSDAETTAGRAGIIHDVSDNWSFEGELTRRDTDGVFRLSSVFGAETENATQDREILEFTPRFIGSVPALNNMSLTVGADIIDSDYYLSSRFGDQFNVQKQDSVYVQAVLPVTKMLELTTGLRYAEVDNDLRDTGTFAYYPDSVQIDDDITVGTLGLAIKASSEYRVLIRADQNYRFAKVDEFLQPAFTPDFTPILLKTQQGLSLESGIEWSRDNNSAKIIFYQLTIDDEIAYDPINFANINLEETERKGVISSAYWQAGKRLAVSASYTLTDAEVIGGTFTGRDIPFVARHAGMLSTAYTVSDAWQVYAEIQAVSERVLSGDFDNVLDKLPGYGLVNVRAEYRIRDFKLGLRVNNLLDREYADTAQRGTNPVTFAPEAAYFPSPEINFLLSAVWTFK